MLKIDYRESDRRAVLSWDRADSGAAWVHTLSRLLHDRVDDASQDGPDRISLPWWSFVSLRRDLQELFQGHGLSIGRGLIVGSQAAELLRQSRQATDDYGALETAPTVTESELTAKLKATGFKRQLSPEQMRNVTRMARLPAAATFSVPGAGKTTEALAWFFFRAQPQDCLLVIAPKNVLAAWDEQMIDCVPTLSESFVRLRGGRERIDRLLAADPRFMIITYQQLALVPDLIAATCARRRAYVFLDESHRIKSGTGKLTARAALGLAHLPIGKLIMSGTPMPQAVDDLLPQFTFLYPEVPVDTGSVIERIRPVFVRTTKTELGLPPVTRVMVSLPMAPMQRELYQLMKFEVAREAATALNIGSKQAFRSLGRSVARLLQFVANPALLSNELAFAQPALLAAVLAEGDGPKLKYVLKKARHLTLQGKKVLLWSSFVRNVEYLAERLSDMGAVYIHGQVDAGDENDDDTREGKIRLFHDDPNVRVMVANPAAASEGISLHRVCHHAIYLDRTFNAAHYLQSEDRIHRLGLPKDQETIVEIVECGETVDETVRERLGYKIGQMAAALDDPSLRPDPIALDPSDIEDFEEYSTGLAPDDIQALLRDMEKEA